MCLTKEQIKVCFLRAYLILGKVEGYSSEIRMTRFLYIKCYFEVKQITGSFKGRGGGAEGVHD